MTEVIYRRCPAVLWRTGMERLVLLPPGREPMTIGGAGLELWDLLSEPRAFASVVGELALRFGVDSERVEAALGPVVGELVGCRVLEEVPT